MYIANNKQVVGSKSFYRDEEIKIPVFHPTWQQSFATQRAVGGKCV
jgi:hypothetical protein